jgi:hypothetical protein
MVAENSVTELQKTAGDFSKIPHLSRKMSNEEAFSPFLRTLSFFQNAAFASCSPILVFLFLEVIRESLLPSFFFSLYFPHYCSQGMELVLKRAHVVIGKDLF